MHISKLPLPWSRFLASSAQSERARPHARRSQQQAALCAALLALAIGAKSVTARADESEAHYRIGLDYKKKGDVGHAIAELRTAISLRPDHAAAQMSLGSLMLETNTYPEALRCFERAIVLRPALLPTPPRRSVRRACSRLSYRGRRGRCRSCCRRRLLCSRSPRLGLALSSSERRVQCSLLQCVRPSVFAFRCSWICRRVA